MRYLDLGTVAAPLSQAVYHALADLAGPTDPVTLVTVSPRQPYVCVGYHQVASREIDRAYCEAHHILVGRRLVGGGAVWLDADQIFWHLVLPRYRGPIEELYRTFLVAPVRAYRRLGIAADYRPINDLVVGARKIGGTGAGTIGFATVVVGSILMDFDSARMARVLRVPSEKFRDKLVESLTDYMTTVRRELGDRAPDRVTATRTLVEAFAEVVRERIEPDRLQPNEEQAMKAWAQRLFDPGFVYRHEGWIQPGVKIREGVRLKEGVAKAPGGLVRIIWREVEGRIDDIVVSGDFFLQPADALDNFRREMLGQPATAENVESAWRKVADGISAPGVSAADLARAFSHADTLTV
jgi:lipoate-protein ligase A